jgi:hypothetical protein
MKTSQFSYRIEPGQRATLRLVGLQFGSQADAVEIEPRDSHSRLDREIDLEIVLNATEFSRGQYDTDGGR